MIELPQQVCCFQITNIHANASDERDHTDALNLRISKILGASKNKKKRKGSQKMYFI